MNIIIVDNSPVAAARLHDLLAMQGHAVLLAFSGRAGIELATIADPDLVMVDLALPDMDGVEVIRTLHSLRKLANCRLVALARISNVGMWRSARHAGAKNFFLKEYGVNALFALTNRARDRTRQNVSRPTASASPCATGDNRTRLSRPLFSTLKSLALRWRL